MDDAADFENDPDVVDDEADAGDADTQVFLDTEDELDDDALAGKTSAKTGRDDDVLAGFDLSGSRPRGELDTDDMLAAAPIFDEPGDDASAPSTGLTVVGIPSFADPPDVSSVDDVASTADESSDGATAAPWLRSPPARGKFDDAEEVFIPGLESPPTTDSIPEIHGLKDVSPAATPNSKRTDVVDSQQASPHRARTAPSPAERRQRLLLILLASYASAMTLAFAWLWLNRGAASPHVLENLPDVAPLNPNEFRFAPQSATMPAGHTLPLGRSEQLGLIRVEPLRVTRGPVEFTHYDDAAQTREPTDPVLKLWVRFTNMSKDQWIAPLDAALLFTRSYQLDTDTILANQLVQPADKQSAATYVLDHPLSSDWDLKGQELGYRLKPGESLETYIPTDPAGKPLTGDLVWRVHFRKGYNPQTGHGVTTMVEVPFAASQIEGDPAGSS